MIKAKSIALYIRTSTIDQNSDLQYRELISFVEARGWHVQKIYEDKCSGTTANRPQLKQLLQDARSRKFDIVCCWKLDRFFRSLSDLTKTLAELSELGIEFISLRDNLDLTTSSGRLMLHVIGAFAEFEASIIKERVRAGIRAAKARGQKLGRPNHIDPSKVIALRSQGHSLSQIAKALGVSKAAVYKILLKLVVTKSDNKSETPDVLKGVKNGH